MRSIDSRLWSDGWIRKLNALDRYLFIYLLTNDHSTWCGVYELDLAMMAFESGIDREDLERSMLPRLSPKVIYVDGWVYIPNWMKYHLSSSGTVSPQHKKGFVAAWNAVPERIREQIERLGGYPIEGVSPSASSIASSYRGAAEPLEYEQVTLREDEETTRAKKPPKYPNAKQVFACWGKYPKNWELNTTQCRAAENLFAEQGLEDIQSAVDFWKKHKDEDFCPQIPTPYDLDSKWAKLEAFYDKKHA